MKVLRYAFCLGALFALAACEKKQEPPPEPAQAEKPAAMAETTPEANLLEDPNVPESFRAAIAGLGASSFGPKGVCAGCEWDKHLGKESPVERIECFDPTGTKKHCHLDVVGYKPKRDVWIRDSGGKLSFSVVSDGDPSAGMECEAEIVAAQPQLISGECTVREQHLVGDPIHNFGALIVEEDAKPLIKFWFWHKGEQKNGNPIHSGEGHSYPDP